MDLRRASGLLIFDSRIVFKCICAKRENDWRMRELCVWPMNLIFAYHFECARCFPRVCGAFQAFGERILATAAGMDGMVWV